MSLSVLQSGCIMTSQGGCVQFSAPSSMGAASFFNEREPSLGARIVEAYEAQQSPRPDAWLYLLNRVRSLTSSFFSYFKVPVAAACGHQCQLEIADRNFDLAASRVSYNNDEAIELYEMAAKTYQAFEKHEMLAKCELNLGLLHTEQGNTETASIHLNQALDEYKAVGDLGGSLDSLIGIGHKLVKQGYCTEGIRFMKDAIKVLEDYFPDDRIHTAVNKSNIGRGCKDHARELIPLRLSALQLLEELIDITDDLYIDTLRHTLYLLYEVDLYPDGLDLCKNLQSKLVGRQDKKAKELSELLVGIISNLEDEINGVSFPKINTKTDSIYY